MDNTNIHNDEPAVEDQLKRKIFSEVFTNLATTCKTPMVIGIYGRWGVGKTSMMKQIKSLLDQDDSIRTVWFDAWRHQFDEHMVLGLLHTMVDKLKIKNEVKKLLNSIARALGSIALKATSSLNIADIENSFKKYEEDNFEVREERVKLYEHFRKIIDRALTTNNGEKRRIVFFIDDLDRCLPNNILAVLESLKLYLDFKGCVYFIGVDRHALESGIRHQYKDLNIDETCYLDKIIQLPFTIPPVTPKNTESFIKSLLPDELNNCEHVLKHGLGDNPRGIKRFVNTLILNYNFAKIKFPDNKPIILAILLLIQYRNPELYFKITRNPSLLNDLSRINDSSNIDNENLFAGDEYLENVLKSVDELPSVEELKSYIYLTEVAGITNEEILYDKHGFLTEDGLEQYLSKSGKLNKNEIVKQKLIIFKTKEQHTWIIATNINIFCLLDDEETRQGHRVIQWRMPKNPSIVVKSRISLKGNYVVDIGQRKSWLYSNALHPDADELTAKILAMIKEE